MLNSVHTSTKFPASHQAGEIDPNMGVQHMTDFSHYTTRCTMAKSVYKQRHNTECHSCFQKFGDVRELSLVSLLVSLPESPGEEKLAAMRQCMMTEGKSISTACIQMTFMPDVMRNFELGLPSPIRTFEDKKSMSLGDLIQSALATNEVNDDKLLILIRWIAKNEKECVLSLTSNYRVVLISMVNQYMWMIRPTGIVRADAIISSC